MAAARRALLALWAQAMLFSCCDALVSKTPSHGSADAVDTPVRALRAKEETEHRAEHAAGKKKESPQEFADHLIAVFVPMGVLVASLLLFPLSGKPVGRLQDAVPEVSLTVAGVVFVFFISGPALTIVNQSILRDWMPYPFFVSTLGPIFVVLATQLAVRTGLKAMESEMPTVRSYCVDILPVSVLQLLSLVTSMWALKDLPVPLYQILTSVGPLVVFFLGILRGAEKMTMGVSLALTLLVLFSVLGVRGGLSDSASAGASAFTTLRGVVMALLSVTVDACRLQMIQRGIGNRNVFDMLYLSMPPLALAGLAYPFSKDARGIVEAAWTPSHMGLLVLVGILGLLANCCSFFIAGRMGAVTLKVLIQTRGACLFSFSAVALHQPCGIQQSISYAGTILASVIYANRKALLSAEAEEKQSLVSRVDSKELKKTAA